MNTLFVLLMKYIIPDRQEWYWNYYLKSAHWQARAKKARSMAGYMCQKCKAEGVPLDVHHKNYRRLFWERSGDLVVVCRKCHKKMHGGKDGRVGR